MEYSTEHFKDEIDSLKQRIKNLEKISTIQTDNLGILIKQITDILAIIKDIVNK